MNSITYELKFRQSVVKYSYRNGVTAAYVQFKVSRRTIYRWRRRYDGTLKSLANKSRRPHTTEEIKMIKDYKYKNKDTGL